jgi:hypothetical protein
MTGFLHADRVDPSTGWMITALEVPLVGWHEIDQRMMHLFLDRSNHFVDRHTIPRLSRAATNPRSADVPETIWWAQGQVSGMRQQIVGHCA